MKIKPMNLIEPLCNQPRFVFIDSSINIFFNSKNPFAANNSPVSRKRHQILGVIKNNGIIFLFHSRQPSWVM